MGYPTSSPKGNDCSPESNVPKSNLILKNIQMGHGNQRPEIKLFRAFMPVLVTSNFDDDLIKIGQPASKIFKFKSVKFSSLKGK